MARPLSAKGTCYPVINVYIVNTAIAITALHVKHKLFKPVDMPKYFDSENSYKY